MLTIDLHVHTKFSDGALKISEVIDLCGEAGLDAIAITDHLCATDGLFGKAAKFLKWTLTEDTWKEYMRVIEKERSRAWREYRMIVFGGVEFTRNTFSHGRNAHLLAIGIKEYISPNQSEESWLKEARQHGALTVAAHPMKVMDASSQTYFLLKNEKLFAPLIDVWEVANARTFWPEMLKTRYALSATTDFHQKNKWNGWRTKLDCEKDPEAILAGIKDQSIERSFVFLEGKEVREEISRHGERKVIAKSSRNLAATIPYSLAYK